MRNSPEFVYRLGPPEGREFLMKLPQRVQAHWATFSQARRRRFRLRAKYCTDARLHCRLLIILNLLQGRTAALIRDVLHCSTSQVYRVADRFLQEGEEGLADRREDNGTHKVTWYYEWSLLQAVAGSPSDYGRRRPTWTQELLAGVLEQQTGIRLSTATLSRLLRRHRIRRGRPKPVVGCPWPKAKKQRRLRQLRRLVRCCPRGEVVVYADEVDIHLNPKIGPDYMLPGTQKQVRTPGQNEKRYIAGALNAQSGKLTWEEWPYKNSDLFLGLLHRLARDYPRAKRIHVIVDNYKIHKSQRTGLALAALGGRVKLHFLPPYCPDDNRIERLWKDLHDNVTRNHTCRSMGELMAEVRAYLHQRAQVLEQQYKKRRAA
jgi:transposase